jgi:photosystem II stability/assembly factor-like uncharacterized protein
VAAGSAGVVDVGLRAEVVSAPVGVWRLIGPTGVGANGGVATGVLFHLAIPAANSDVVYVSSTTSGVWASADRCVSWREARGNLPTLNVVGLAVDAGDPEHVYAAISGDGVYVSADGGGNWSKAGGPSALPALTDLIVDPTDSRHLYLRASDGVYGSDDGGASWQRLLAGQATHLILGPAGGQVVYAGVPGQGVLRSTDAGATWWSLTPAAGAFDIRVAPSAADAAVIYARFRITGPLAEFWSSTDGGSTWTQVSSTALDTFATTDPYISVILADATDANRVYVGGRYLWRSDDGGASWNSKNSPHQDYHMLLFDPGTPTDLYAASDGGLYRSQQADNWKFVADGIPNIEFYDLAVSATKPELVIGGTQDNGTLLTDGSTAHWREIGGYGDGATVAIDPADPQVMYVMDQYASSIARSDDGGGSFTNVANGLPGGSAGENLRFGVHPKNSNLLVACVGPLWQTEVSNIDWAPIFTPPGAPGEGVVCYAIARDNTYYAGTNTGRIYLGLDGAGWQLAFAHPNAAAVNDLVVDPNDAATVLYAAFAGGSTDRVYRFNRNASPVVVAVAHASASRPQPGLSFGLLRALGGATGPLTAGQIGSPTLPLGLTVQTLAVDAMRPFTIYAGTNRGVYRATSSDRGASWTWSDYNIGLPPADVRALRVQASTGVLRAGTFGRSAYEVSTDTPVGSLLNATGRLTFLRAHDVGTGWGGPPNTLDAEIIMLLDTIPWMSFGFQLRADSEAPTRQDMLALLRAAFVDDTPVSIDYIRTAPRAGMVIRVARAG